MQQIWKDIKKQNLLDAVVRVLSRNGLEGLTMDSVAREAGVAKGTLYAYFHNKQDAIKEAVEAIVVPMVEQLTSILGSDLSPAERLRRMTLRHLTYFEENREFFRIFVNDRMAAQQRLKRYRSSHYQGFLESTARVLEEGIRSEQFRPMDCLKVAAMLVESDIAVIHQRLVTDQPGPVEEDAALITDLFIHGIQRTT